jgi:hypothetical protein
MRSLDFELMDWLVIRTILGVEIQSLGGGGVMEGGDSIGGRIWLSISLGTEQSQMSRYVGRLPENRRQGSLILKANSRGCAEGSNT